MRVAGRRGTVEGTFQAAKRLAGLDEHQVRRWTSWHRWVTLAMLAHAFLAATSTHVRDHHPAPDELIPLTCNETQRLFSAFIAQGVRQPHTAWAGPTGGDAIKPAPAPPTTADTPPHTREGAWSARRFTVPPG